MKERDESLSKTGCMGVNEREGGGMVQLTLHKLI